MRQFDLLISVLTLPEVSYLEPMVRKMIDGGNKIGFMLFHEAGAEILEKHRIPYFNMFDEIEKCDEKNPTLADIELLRSEFGIVNFADLYVHEKMGYGRPDEDKLGQKVYAYLKTVDRIFSENDVRSVMQELGGYTPNHAVYHAARKNSIPHIFYEPAPFKRRVVFNKDSFFSNMPEDILAKTSSDQTKREVKKYLGDYLKEQSVLKPFKDAHRYKDQSISKIFNMDNAGRLLRKLKHKYLEKKREEYNEIGFVIKDAFKRYFRRKLISSKYETPDYSEKYVYFPFHVPYDVQLSSRSRLFYNQEGFVEYLCRSIPHGWKVCVKEHPTCIGGHSYSVLRKTLELHKNLTLVHPGVNSFDLIKNSEIVATVNSKVGFEALMQGKKVLVVGDVFYKGKGVTFDCDNLVSLPEVIRKAADSSPPEMERIMDILGKAWEWSRPAELFLLEDDNMKVSAETFYSYLKNSGILK